MSNSQVEVYYKEDENGEWYSAVIQDDAVYQMNGAADDLQFGYNQFIGTIGENGLVRDNLGEEIALEDCPEHIQEAIEEHASE